MGCIPPQPPVAADLRRLQDTGKVLAEAIRRSGVTTEQAMRNLLSVNRRSVHISDVIRSPVSPRLVSILRETIRETNASIEHCATVFAATPRIDREPLPSEERKGCKA